MAKDDEKTKRHSRRWVYERIKLLEAALIKYIEMYGFTDEARDYYIRVPQFKSSETHH